MNNEINKKMNEINKKVKKWKINEIMKWIKYKCTNEKNLKNE